LHVYSVPLFQTCLNAKSGEGNQLCNFAEPATSMAKAGSRLFLQLIYKSRQENTPQVGAREPSFCRAEPLRNYLQWDSQPASIKLIVRHSKGKNAHS
jgi:hypothetical protein